jgi:hypothetical protein
MISQSDASGTNVFSTDVFYKGSRSYGTLVSASGATASAASGESESSCSGCLAYRVSPQVIGLDRGNLQVDPEIILPSPGMNVEVAYFYNSNSSYNGPFGFGRTINLNLTAQASPVLVTVSSASVTVTLVTLTRGNGSAVNYQENATSGQFDPQTRGLLNSLTKDTANNRWLETALDGTITAYPLNPNGQLSSIVWAQDAVGNHHTFSYASGLLQSLEDAVGRLVTFSYNPDNLLSTIQDWQAASPASLTTP